MAFDGGIKFFETNKVLESTGATISASSGANSAENAIDRNTLTVWRSVGSNDSTQEILIITPANPISVNRIFCLGINWKDFDIQYDSDGTPTWTNFSSVRGLDTDPLSLGSQINETIWADSSAYYEVASVTAYAFRIRIDKTQVANQEKYLNQFIATTALGDLLGFPIIESVTPDRNARVSKSSSGRVSIMKGLETFAININFDNYPIGFKDDVNFMFTLHDDDDPFLIWLCGGNRNAPYFGHTARGFRLEDVIPMQIASAPDQTYRNNIYISQLSMQFTLQESIL